MAYFPNGTAGMMFENDYCVRCLNYRDKDDGRGHGCAVMDCHSIANYDQCGEAPAAKMAAVLLGILIPSDGIHPGECAMLREDGKDHATLPLFGGSEKSADDPA